MTTKPDEQDNPLYPLPDIKEKDKEPSKSNPQNPPTDTKLMDDRISKLEEIITEMGPAVATALDEIKANANVTVLESPSTPQGQQIATIKELSQIQVNMMGPFLKIFEAAAGFGENIGEMKASLAYETEEKNHAIDQLEKIQVALDAMPAKPGVNYGELMETIKPTINELIDVFKSRLPPKK